MELPQNIQPTSTNPAVKALPTCNFFLVVIIVTGSQQLSKDKSRDINFLHFVLNNGNTLPIIPHTHCVVLSVRGKNEVNTNVFLY